MRYQVLPPWRRGSGSIARCTEDKSDAGVERRSTVVQESVCQLISAIKLGKGLAIQRGEILVEELVLVARLTAACEFDALDQAGPIQSLRCHAGRDLQVCHDGRPGVACRNGIGYKPSTDKGQYPL